MKPEDEISIPLNYSSIKVLPQCTPSLDIRFTPWHFCTFNENLWDKYLYFVIWDVQMPVYQPQESEERKVGAQDDGTNSK